MKRSILPAVFMAAVIVGAASTTSGQTIHHVDPGAIGGAANGTSWSDAYLDLSSACAIAVAGDAIHIAGGTYTPGTSRYDSFAVPIDTWVRGGFAGHGWPDPDARDFWMHETVLSGDLAGNDLPGFGNRTDNAYHVAYITPVGPGTAHFDGVTIRGGQADGIGSFVESMGGGLFGNQGNLELIDCRIIDNFAGLWGAGVFHQVGTLVALRCEFSDNRVQCDNELGIDDCGGAGLMAVDSSDVQILGCRFTDNVVQLNSFPEIRAHAAGAVVDTGGGATIDHCDFIGNQVWAPIAEYAAGGGLELLVAGAGRLADSLFLDNFVDGPLQIPWEGGAGALVQGSVRVATCRFLGNEAPASFGGGLLISDLGGATDALAVDSCEFSGNHAADGGGLYTYVSSQRDVVNCTFSRNTAGGRGGGAHVDDVVRIYNSILWGNADSGGTDESAQVDTNDVGLPTLGRSIVQGYTGTYPGGNCTGADPLFLDDDGGDNVAGTFDDDLRVAAGSPAIDAASNARILPDVADLDGDGNLTEQVPLEVGGLARRADDPATVDTGQGNVPIVDRGAHEYGALLPEQQWTDLGAALAGTHGDPVLVGRGTLTAFTLYQIELTNVLANTTATLVLGIVPIQAAFKGGTLVPSPNILIAGLPTGPAGAISFTAPWLTQEYPGVPLWWQYWINDPGGPFGWAASNALESLTPGAP